jgi:hypothetical protein
VSAGTKVMRLFRDAVFDNIGLKVISIAFSLGFYAFIHGAQNAQRSFPVSVVVLLPREAQNRILLTQPPPTVRVTVHAMRSSLDDLKAEDLGSLQLDLRKGTETYGSFDASGLNLPPGHRLEIDPPGIPLTWDDVITREVPIQVSVTGQPLTGYAVQGPPIADPRSVQARGPKTVVETLQHARTEPFDIGGLAEGEHSRKISIDRPPPRVTFDEQTTNITVVIGRARMERVYVKLPVHVVGLARATTIPAEVDVHVNGPPELVGILRPEQIVPTVDVRVLTADLKVPGSAKAPVLATVEGCQTQVIPSSVVVKW